MIHLPNGFIVGEISQPGFTEAARGDNTSRALDCACASPRRRIPVDSRFVGGMSCTLHALSRRFAVLQQPERLTGVRRTTILADDPTRFPGTQQYPAVSFPEPD
jgi:hypothetical protein